MISIITFTNLFMLAFALHPSARSWGSPAWHLEPPSPWANQVPAVQEQGPGQTGHPVQWQDSQALSQWQEDAAASLAYPLQTHHGHSHYSQLFAQSQPQMNSLGQPGFSPYGTPFHYVRTGEAVRSPKYTTVLKHLDETAGALNKQVSLNEEGKLSDAQIQYVMVLTAVNDLIDDAINIGGESYAKRYKTIVDDAIAKVEKNPLAAASSIRARIVAVKSQLSGIINLIKTKQAECTEPISAECDKVIDQALDQSGDAALQTTASFLIALADSVELFSKDYLTEVAQVANSHGAVNYLKNAQEHMLPLMLAGAKARRIGLQVKLLPLLRTNINRRDNHLKHNRRDNHLNNLDNALQYRRNSNHHDDQ